MSWSTWFIDMMARIKPLLLRIFPKEILQSAKRKWLAGDIKQIKKVKIAPYDRGRFPKGVNLIGNIRGSSGLGQSIRLLADELKAAGYPLDVVQYSISGKQNVSDTSYDGPVAQKGRYGINIFHINMHEFATAFRQLGRETWDYHYNIGFWLWELADFPDQWVDGIRLLDEIWTPAEFVSESIRKKTDKPVYTIPYHVTAPIRSEYDRAYFGLPRGTFLFAVIFDCGSMMERKNPEAVIKSYKKAFTAQEPVGLVIKASGCTGEEAARISKLLSGYKNVFLMTNVLTKAEINSLIACTDVLVSLHRAEGFGLVMAEAMQNGTPCIATGWSANTEFMNEETSCMVGYRMARIEKPIGPYMPGNYWAEADTDEAAGYMRRLYEDPKFYQEKKMKAKAYIDEKLDMRLVAGKIRERISKVQET